MRSIRQQTLLAAAAFVFAAGFTSSALAQGCFGCQTIYDNCMTQTFGNYGICAHEYNVCAQPINCPLMPEIIIDP